MDEWNRTATAPATVRCDWCSSFVSEDELLRCDECGEQICRHCAERVPGAVYCFGCYDCVGWD